MSPTFPQNVEIRNVLREASVARHIQSWRLRSFWRQLKSRDVNCEGMDRQSCREESKRRRPRPPAPSRVRARHRLHFCVSQTIRQYRTKYSCTGQAIVLQIFQERNMLGCGILFPGCLWQKCMVTQSSHCLFDMFGKKPEWKDSTELDTH